MFSKVKDLKPHPRNKEFFDDMSGDKWNEFLESIKTSGIIEPIVITQDNIVVSGHQRLRAAKELKLDLVPTIMKTYRSEDEILKDLLETNVRQRGSINTSSVKSAAIISTLEKIARINNFNDIDHIENPLLQYYKSQFNFEISPNLNSLLEFLNYIYKLSFFLFLLRYIYLLLFLPNLQIFLLFLLFLGLYQ